MLRGLRRYKMRDAVALACLFDHSDDDVKGPRPFYPQAQTESRRSLIHSLACNRKAAERLVDRSVKSNDLVVSCGGSSSTSVVYQVSPAVTYPATI